MVASTFAALFCHLAQACFRTRVCIAALLGHTCTSFTCLNVAPQWCVRLSVTFTAQLGRHTTAESRAERSRPCAQFYLLRSAEFVCGKECEYSILKLLAVHEVLLDKLITEGCTCSGAAETCR